MKLRGIGVSPGIALGRALLLEIPERPVFRLTLSDAAVPIELERLDAARAAAREQLRELRAGMAAEIGETYASVFDAHLLILDDPSVNREAERRIREDRANAEWALHRAFQGALERLRAVADPYIRERGHDLEDVHERLQAVLEGGAMRHDLSELTEDAIVVAASLSPSDATLIRHPHVVGFLTAGGGRTSHTAILANALGIPAVVGVGEAPRAIRNGQRLVVDGSAGLVEIEPDEAAAASYAEARSAFLRHEEELADRAGPTTTADGERVVLQANVEFPDEMETVGRTGAEGVGLYRSEFLFLTHSPALPRESDHEAAYRSLAAAAGSHEVTIRTLDLGGEKYFHEVLEHDEPNPVMGLRGARLCLHRPDIFRVQLRGLLRASVDGNLRVMFPLITGLGELRDLRAVLDEVRNELRAEGLDLPPLPVGIMIETPSAALVAPELAREVDFFSIGTNDLIQYTLAIDRSNPSVSYLYEPFHPAILRQLRTTVEAARHAEIEVNVCGEMACDPLGAVVLLGLGLRKLSMNALMIPDIRDLIRTVSAADAEAGVREALAAPTAEEVRTVLMRRFGDVVLVEDAASQED